MVHSGHSGPPCEIGISENFIRLLLDAGYKRQDTRYKMQDTEIQKSANLQINYSRSMSSKFSHAVPFMPVRNLKETINYYRDQLGFSDEWFWEDTDAGIRRNDLRLLFMHDPEFVSRINENGRHFEICWFVRNVDEVYKEYQLKEVNIVSKLEVKPWNVKEFTLEEINGYWIRVGQGQESV